VGAHPVVDAVPGDARHLPVQIRGERRRRIRPDDLPPPVHETGYLFQLREVSTSEDLDQAGNGQQPLVASGEIAAFLSQRPFGEGSDVPAQHQDGHVGREILDGAADRARAGHVLRRGGRLVAVDQDGRQQRPVIVHTGRCLLGCQVLGCRIDDRHRAAASGDRGDQTCPDRRLDRGQRPAEVLISAKAIAGIDKDQIERTAHRLSCRGAEGGNGDDRNAAIIE